MPSDYPLSKVMFEYLYGGSGEHVRLIHEYDADAPLFWADGDAPSIEERTSERRPPMPREALIQAAAALDAVWETDYKNEPHFMGEEDVGDKTLDSYSCCACNITLFTVVGAGDDSFVHADTCARELVRKARSAIAALNAEG